MDESGVYLYSEGYSYRFLYHVVSYESRALGKFASVKGMHVDVCTF